MYAIRSYYVRDFLQQTSALDRLCAPLCDVVTGTANSRNLLIRLEQANMFLMRLDENRQWFRYHPLFAEFLRAECDATEQQRQHQQASRWYAANNFEEEAISYNFV